MQYRKSHTKSVHLNGEDCTLISENDKERVLEAEINAVDDSFYVCSNQSGLNGKRKTFEKCIS